VPPPPPLLLVGCGNMGGALLAGWREQGFTDVAVVDPAAVGREDGVLVLDGPEHLPDGFAPAAVVLAIKPQAAAEVLPRYAGFAGRAVFVSIMAGQTIAGISARLGAGAAVVRAMPNTPAAIRHGMTVACAGPGVTEADYALSERLLAAVGKVARVHDEGLLDAVTAVSGSGPAYVFLLAEAMEQAAVAQGLPAALARLISRETIAGAGALLAASPQESAALRRAVTSPGGTTQAALEVLLAGDAWAGTLRRAIGAATERSRALRG
jgi:pyrroline-5-carboxylate reductase